MLQGIYGDNALGPVHGLGPTNGNFLLQIGNPVTRVSVSKTYHLYLTIVLQGQCVEYYKSRNIVGSLKLTLCDGGTRSFGE
jgi:hypothetical protein